MSFRAQPFAADLRHALRTLDRSPGYADADKFRVPR